MSTPLSTPMRHAKLGISSSKSSPLTNEYKKLLNEQHNRLWTKHQQDLDLIDDIRSYVKARLSIEREYSSSLQKLGKQHAAHIVKKFPLLPQCDPAANGSRGSKQHQQQQQQQQQQQLQDLNNNNPSDQRQDELRSDSRFQKRLANNGIDEPERPSSLYKVWSEHINRLQSTSKNRSDQFEQLIIIVDKLKDIRSHKASIGKKCLDTHLKRIHEDILVSMVEIEKTRKLYYEDESQAKKARENEEKIKKKKSSLLTKFTDLQAKKEKTSAQREANDIQSTQARNDYIMALAAGNAHLQHYYERDLNDFIHLIDDGVLDHCKIFMATLSECDINSLKDSLTHAQYWAKMINLTGSQRTNAIFLECEQSACLRTANQLDFEACNNDPINYISLEHNADYALQHEIDKWFTWFKKECRNLSQLMHQLDQCQHAAAEGKKTIELNGQTSEEVEPKIIELKQQIRKCEAAKLKAQARLKVIKEGGMQIEEWSTVEAEIRADMARAQEELEVRRLKEAATREESSCEPQEQRLIDKHTHQSSSGYLFGGGDDDVDQVHHDQVHLHVSKDSDDDESEMGGASMNQLASVSRSTSNLMQKQQNAMSGYSALTDPSLVWQDDYSSAWGAGGGGGSTNQAPITVVMDNSSALNDDEHDPRQQATKNVVTSYDLLTTKAKGSQDKLASMTVQSSSPLSAIVDGNQSSPSPYQGMVGEAYKSDYECDYNRNSGHGHRSAASSAEPFNHLPGASHQQHLDPFGAPISEREGETLEEEANGARFNDHFGAGDASATTGSGAVDGQGPETSVFAILNKEVVALYSFDKTNEDDLAFNESDILRVIEVSDANWVKARNEATGNEGFIPTSYVQLRDSAAQSGESGAELQEAKRQPGECQDASGGVASDGQFGATTKDPNYATDSSQMEQQQQIGGWSMDSGTQKADKDAEIAYCRAVYDYEPELNTFEEDGLPHLSLAQGELMRVIDQGEDDGWWLVEKQDGSGTRGHVPSMLVEEVEPGESGNEQEEEEDADDGEASDYSDQDDYEDPDGGSVKMAAPSFEPPPLPAPEAPEISVDVEAIGAEIDEPIEVTNSSTAGGKTDEVATADKVGQQSSGSLVATSFIIIEPTPEVESRRVEDSIRAETSKEGGDTDDLDEQQAHRQDGSQVAGVAGSGYTTTTTTEPPSGVSYSVVNEGFVLEGPPRKPEPQRQQTEEEQTSEDAPAPPSVVIDVSFFEDHSNGNNDSNNNNQQGDQDKSEASNEERAGDEVEQQSPYHYAIPQKVEKIKQQTTNVDVSPILRMRAEEFSKQIIAEAIMLVPGTSVGPSTSSPLEECEPEMARSPSSSLDDD